MGYFIWVLGRRKITMVQRIKGIVNALSILVTVFGIHLIFEDGELAPTFKSWLLTTSPYVTILVLLVVMVIVVMAIRSISGLQIPERIVRAVEMQIPSTASKKQTKAIKVIALILYSIIAFILGFVWLELSGVINWIH